MNKCGKTVLKWKEPKDFQNYKDRHLSLTMRLLKKYSPSFLAGFIIFFVLILIESESIPKSFSEFLFLSAICSVMGIIFVIIYGLVELASPRIYIKENCIIRQHGESVIQLKYLELRGYDISNILHNDKNIKLIIFENSNYQRNNFAIAYSTSIQEIEEALINKVERIQIDNKSFDFVE